VTHGGDQGARMAIRLLQDAAERGEIDPWDVDVIAVIDGFLDQLRQTLDLPRQLAALGGSYEQGLAASSEAFLAASVLVALKAEHLEERTLAAGQDTVEDALEAEFDDGGDAEGWPARLALPARPERLLSRRPVAPPPLRRPVSLGELIRQLEDIASRLEQEAGEGGHRSRRTRRYSDREAIAQVAALAHREKLPETTAALALFLADWEPAADNGCDFEQLVQAWETAAPPDLDRDRVGVFWALLFLCAQGRVTLEQDPQDLFGSLRLARCSAERPLQLSMVAAGTPAETAAAA